MANENDQIEDNENLQNDNQQIDNQQQQDNNQPITGNDSWDKQLEAFANETARAPIKGQGEEQDSNKQQQNRQQVQNRQQQNQDNRTDNRQQSNDNRRQVQQIPPVTRQYGDRYFQAQDGSIRNAEGKLIAKPGYQHAVFREVYQHVEATEKERDALKIRLENYDKANQAARDAGLSLDEQSAALSLMVAWKKEPMKALNFLLDQATTRGLDISAIRQGGGFDMSVLDTRLGELLDKRLEKFNPFIEQFNNDRQAQTQQAELYAKVNESLEEFRQDFPDAKIHEGPIAELMNALHGQGKTVDVREAYYILKTDALQRGLNWSQPLMPQYQAWQQRNGNNNNNNTPNQGNNRPLPNMNGRNSNGVVNSGSRGPAPATDSWDNIIRDVGREQGFEFN